MAVAPDQTTVYTMTADGQSGTLSAAATVFVE
jgi:hypothetical protein